MECFQFQSKAPEVLIVLFKCCPLFQPAKLKQTSVCVQLSADFRRGGL